MKRKPTAVIALGGNALLRAGERASLNAQLVNARRAARSIGALARRHRVVITHGNGPQVGALMLRSEIAAPKAYAVTLDVAVAQSVGEIGYMIQQAVQNETGARVVSVVTQVVVSRRDPAFRSPKKRIGPKSLHRVVASPRPREIVEAEAIDHLLRGGFTVVATGGGGIPVERRPDGRLRGVEAVIDKDLSSAALADGLGADALFLLTDVDAVYLDFERPEARRLDHLTPSQARRHLAEGQFPAGSMGPKVQAAVEFVGTSARRRAVIGALDDPDCGTVVSNRSVRA